MQTLNYLITLLALIAALLAWIAKLKWSKEFKEAKEAEIKAKNAQMDTIREKAELYESIVSKKLINHAKQTIAELEQLLVKTEKSKQEEIKKVLNKMKENEKVQKQKYLGNENDLLITIFRKLRTPINGIIGLSELAMSDNINKDNKLEYIKIINQNGIQLFDILEDVIQFRISLRTMNQNEDKIK